MTVVAKKSQSGAAFRTTPQKSCNPLNLGRYCCGAAFAAHALLGRFLPRLGPLWRQSGLLFCRKAIAGGACQVELFRSETTDSWRGGFFRNCLYSFPQSFRKHGRSRQAPDGALVHVKRTVDLDLNCMATLRGSTIKLGNVAARIGFVAPDREARTPAAINRVARRSMLLRWIRSDRRARCRSWRRPASSTASNENRSRIARPKRLPRTFDQALQRRVIRRVQRGDSCPALLRLSAAGDRSAAPRRPHGELNQVRPRPSASGCWRSLAGGRRTSADRVRRPRGSHRDRRAGSGRATTARLDQR